MIPIEEQRVGIIGFGNVGQSIAFALVEKAQEIIALDTTERLAELGIPNCETKLLLTDQWQALVSCQTILVCIDTPLDVVGATVNVDNIRSALVSLSKIICNGQLVLLKSSCPPGFCLSKALPILESSGLKVGRDFFLAVTPERMSEGLGNDELFLIPALIGGVTDKCHDRAREFLYECFGVPTIELNPTEAEIAKLSCNAFIDTSIALANTIAKKCDEYNVNAVRVISAANTLSKGGREINILAPSMGVGGTCLPKDTYILDMNPMIAAVRAINDGMPQYTVDKIRTVMTDLSGKKVLIMGASFKANAHHLKNTPVKPLCTAFSLEGVDMYISDPLFGRDELQKTFPECTALDISEIEHIKWDVLYVAAYHYEFRQLYFSSLEKSVGAVLFDGRAALSRHELEEAGWNYMGVGL